ncbi:MAG: hypothetical protein Q7W38_12210, partial [Deltaproteobacteria bacterium]|nr:hypothetical protein [Deltaproteobacteria bacterium]
MGVVISLESQTLNIPALGIHNVNLRVPTAVGDESNLFAVGRPSRRNINGGVIGQAQQSRAILVDDVYVWVTVFAQGKRETLAIR